MGKALSDPVSKCWRQGRRCVVSGANRMGSSYRDWRENGLRNQLLEAMNAGDTARVGKIRAKLVTDTQQQRRQSGSNSNGNSAPNNAVANFRKTTKMTH
jgi:hypothetical protein